VARRIGSNERKWEGKQARKRTGKKRKDNKRPKNNLTKTAWNAPHTLHTQLQNLKVGHVTL